MYPVTDILVPDVVRDFFFILFVNEDERVMLWVGRVVFDPVLTWVLSFFLAVSNGDVGWCGYALEEGRWGSNFSDSVFEVWFNFVHKCGHVC